MQTRVLPITSHSARVGAQAGWGLTWCHMWNRMRGHQDQAAGCEAHEASVLKSHSWVQIPSTSTLQPGDSWQATKSGRVLAFSPGRQLVILCIPIPYNTTWVVVVRILYIYELSLLSVFSDVAHCLCWALCKPLIEAGWCASLSSKAGFLTFPFTVESVSWAVAATEPKTSTRVDLFVIIPSNYIVSTVSRFQGFLTSWI